MDEIQLKGITDTINKSVSDLQKGLDMKASKVDIDAMQSKLDTLKDSLAGIEMVGEVKISSYLETMQKHVDSIESEMISLATAPVNKGQKALFDVIKSDDFKNNVKNKAGKEYSIEMLKSLGTSTFTAANGTVALDQYSVPGIVKDPWRDNPLFALINKQFVGEKVDSIKWYEENVRADNAAGIAEKGTYVESTNSWIRRTEDFYKIGHFAQFTEEMLEDADYVMGEINDLLLNGVNRAVETDLYTGVNANNTINGLINSTAQKAKTFARPTGLNTVQDANIYDLIKAARLQVYLGNTADTNKRGYIANACLMTPQTIAQMHLEKDSNGNYILPPFTSADGMMVSGCKIIESMDVPDGKFIVGDFSKAKAYIKRAISLRTSDNVASTFLEDILTIKAAIRMAFVVPTKHTYAFVYGDIVSGIAALGA